eukprot:scaffold455_cov155-Ochromonas_danica.AAC.4
MDSPFDLQTTWLQNPYNLDRRLIKAISKLGFVYPTLVQAQTIPLALEGKDILVRARTGSGKTLAFALPLLQKILQNKSQGGGAGGVQGIILAPTKELIKQIAKCVSDLLYYCRDDLTLCTITEDNVNVLDYKMRALPDIILSTPAKLVAALKGGALDLSSAQTFVLDEADLVLSYGYKEDIHKITSKMPKIFQGLLVSATLSAELDKFKRLLLHQPVVLKLEEAQNTNNLMQFYVDMSEEDKYLALYVFLKLGILQGKGLIFVNDVNKCYKLKLFLQQFFISAAVLNAEIPLNSRTHILEEFNRGVFDYLIATDASVDTGEEDDESDAEEEEHVSEDGEQLGSDDDEEEEDDEENEEEEEQEEEQRRPSKKSKSSHPSSSSSSSANHHQADNEDEYGVSRGIDFQAVNFVVNFDFPVTAAAYIHRIGRTARGQSSGLALSFLLNPHLATSSKERERAEREVDLLLDIQSRQPRLGRGAGGAGGLVENDHALAAIYTASEEAEGTGGESQPSLLNFNRQELEAFRYRVEDVHRSITRVAVKEMRGAELRREILHSDKLQSYFQERPEDLHVLRHDKAVLHPLRQKDHLRFLPDYLIPQSMRALNVQTQGKNQKSNRRKNLKRKQSQALEEEPQERRVQSSEQDEEGASHSRHLPHIAQALKMSWLVSLLPCFPLLFPSLLC